MASGTFTPQETRCIDAVVRLLRERHGGSWVHSSAPDREFNNEKTPELIVSNGTISVAIEVKRLLGSQLWLEYQDAWGSLRRWMPPNNGFFILSPPHEVSFPFSSKQLKAVKTAISRECESVSDKDWHVLASLGQANGQPWKIIRSESKHGDGVEVISAVVEDWPGSVRECVLRSIDSGAGKFRRQWADIHVLALDCSPMAPADEVLDQLSTIEDERFGSVDWIVVVDGDEAQFGLRRPQEVQR